MQSRMIQYMNQWFLSLQKGIKTIEYWNYRLVKQGIQILHTKQVFESIYQPFLSTRFLI